MTRLWSALNHVLFIMTDHDQPVFVREGNPGSRNSVSWHTRSFYGYQRYWHARLWSGRGTIAIKLKDQNTETWTNLLLKTTLVVKLLSRRYNYKYFAQINWAGATKSFSTPIFSWNSYLLFINSNLEIKCL